MRYVFERVDANGDVVSSFIFQTQRMEDRGSLIRSRKESWPLRVYLELEDGEGKDSGLPTQIELPGVQGFGTGFSVDDICQEVSLVLVGV